MRQTILSGNASRRNIQPSCGPHIVLHSYLRCRPVSQPTDKPTMYCTVLLFEISFCKEHSIHVPRFSPFPQSYSGFHAHSSCTKHYLVAVGISAPVASEKMGRVSMKRATLDSTLPKMTHLKPYWAEVLVAINTLHLDPRNFISYSSKSNDNVSAETAYLHTYTSFTNSLTFSL